MGMKYQKHCNWKTTETQPQPTEMKHLHQSPKLKAELLATKIKPTNPSRSQAHREQGKNFTTP